MNKKEDVDRIRQLLEQYKNGLTIDEVSKHLGINRSTASKYLNMLVSTGVATIRKLGPAKLFYLRERVPIYDLLDCLPEGIAIVDSSFCVRHVNETLASLFGIDGNSLIGSVVFETPLSSLFDSETMHAIETISSKRGVTTQGSITVDGKTIDIQKRIHPVQFESGTGGYCIVCHLDGEPERDQTIESGRFHTEIAVYDQFFKLDSLFRRYTKNRVAIALETLKRAIDNREPAQLHEFMREEGEILQALLVQIRIFDEFLDDIPPKPGWYSLEEVIGNALSIVRLSHIRFFSDIRGVEIFSDKSISRVFQTLIENSIVHGKRVTSIRITARKSPEGLSIIYEDDGIGIPDSEKSNLFEWGHGMNRGHSLFLCRQVLAATDISIKETGVYNRGARFEITVPSGKYRIRAGYQV